MPILVNGEEVPLQLIADEMARLRELPEWKKAAGQIATALALREAAEIGAINRVLLRQESEQDPTPIDPDDIEREAEKARKGVGCRSDVNEQWYRETAERQLRFQRTLRKLLGDVRGPSRHAVRQAYDAHLESFRLPEEVHVAHIVRHVDEVRPEAPARAGIEAALAALESGEPFSAVVESHSECKERGGDLGFFARGVMVEPFENAVFALRPGERTGIFRSQLGFHTAELRGRRPSRVAEFEEVAPGVERALLRWPSKRNFAARSKSCGDTQK